MVLFRPSKNTNLVFNKKQVLSDIAKVVSEKFPTLHMVMIPESQEENAPPHFYDVLLIRTRSFEVKKVIGQYDGLNTMRLQQVFAIKVIDPKDHRKRNEHEEINLRQAFTHYLVTDNVRDVIRSLEFEE